MTAVWSEIEIILGIGCVLITTCDLLLQTDHSAYIEINVIKWQNKAQRQLQKIV